MHWAELGPPAAQRSAPPVLLLHGLADAHLTWRAAAPLIARDRQVLMPDLPGCGWSSRPDASYSLDWHANVIARWVEALRLEQVDVVGHSFGGGLAQMLLLKCKPRVRRLALVASGGLGREVGPWLRLASLPGVVEYLGQPFMGFGTRQAVGDDQQGRTVDEIAELAAMNEVRGTARAFARTARDVIDVWGQRKLFYDRAREAGALPPTRLFWGDHDALIPIAHGRALVEATRGVRLETFEDCGHYLHQQQPERFARSLLAFLDDPAVPPARLLGEPQPGASAALLGLDRSPQPALCRAPLRRP